MSLEKLSDKALLADGKAIAQMDRENLIRMIYHLREVERRRLFSALKHPSLFEYVITELKYSETAALRRITAMRLMREIPELEEKIYSGSLSLSILTLAQTMFSKERKAGRPMNVTDKKKVLLSMENQSARGAEKILSSVSPEMRKRRPLDYSDIENDILREKLLRLRGRLAHTNANIGLEDLLHILCDNALARILPPTSEVQKETATSMAAIRRAVWSRDQGRCIHCKSTYAVEIDHILPRAAGGASTLSNMRLLCRSCNQRAAIEYFGSKKMSRHLRSCMITYG